MSQIRNDKDAKVGLSGLFGGARTTEAPNTENKDGAKTREDIIETLSPETKEALQKEIQRRQYLKAGRPPKGEEKEKDYIRMTFLISPAKQNRLREIALQEGLFIKEVLDRGIDLVIEEYEQRGSIGK